MPVARDDQPFIDALGRRLRRARHTAGISQRQLATKTGLTPTTISRVENGKRSPELVTVLLILRTLGRPLSDVLDAIRWVPASEDAPAHWRDGPPGADK